MNLKTKIPAKRMVHFLSKLAMIITVIWAINGIMDEYFSTTVENLFHSGLEGYYHVAPILAYSFSATLILFVLVKIEKWSEGDPKDTSTRL